MVVAVLVGTAGAAAAAAAADTEKPTVPADVHHAFNGTTITLTWDASTDNVGVTSYVITRQFQDMMSVYTSTTNSVTVPNSLGAGQSYTFRISARDAAGNSSAAAAFTVTAPPAASCKVSYRVSADWGTGFLGEATIQNLRPTPVSQWQLGWTYTGGQRITSIWNAELTSGTAAAVVIRGPASGPDIAAHGSVWFGFTASSPGGNPAPTAFTLNGTACAIG